MEFLRHVLVLVFFLGSAFFFIVGTVGLMRMPDAYCRMHATTKCDTLGAGLALVGLMVLLGFTVTSAKLLIIIIFIWLTNPTAAHIIAKAAFSKKMIQGVRCILPSGEEDATWKL